MQAKPAYSYRVPRGPIPGRFQLIRRLLGSRPREVQDAVRTREHILETAHGIWWAMVDGASGVVNLLELMDVADIRIEELGSDVTRENFESAVLRDVQEILVYWRNPGHYADPPDFEYELKKLIRLRGAKLLLAAGATFDELRELGVKESDLGGLTELTEGLVPS